MKGHWVAEKSLMLEIHSLELSRDPPFRVPRKAVHGAVSHCATQGGLVGEAAGHHALQDVNAEDVAHAIGARSRKKISCLL